ncbi:MAG: hypothetical protein LBH43_00060 [Treponema sp.]|nr:hypothetical protein [Treponema sp.]
MEKSVCPRGGAVNISWDKPRPAFYPIQKNGDANRMPVIYEASKRGGLGGKAFCGVRPALKTSGTKA